MTYFQDPLTYLQLPVDHISSVTRTTSMSFLKSPWPSLLARLCSFLCSTYTAPEVLTIRQPTTSLRSRESNRNQGTELKDKTSYQHQEPQTSMPGQQFKNTTFNTQSNRPPPGPSSLLHRAGPESRSTAEAHKDLKNGNHAHVQRP